MSDEISDIYNAHVEERQMESNKSVSRSFSRNQQIAIFATMVILFYLVYISEKPWSLGSAVILLIIEVGFFYMINQDQTASAGWLSEKVIKAILIKELEWKQRHTGEVPEGTIRGTLVCKLRWIDGKPWKWVTPVDIDRTDGGIETYLIEQHPYTGEIIAIKDIPEGFTGKEAPDIIKIWPKETLEQRDYNKLMRPARQTR